MGLYFSIKKGKNREYLHKYYIYRKKHFEEKKAVL